MAPSYHPKGTQGKPSIDFRSPQEKGKPAHATAHEQVGRGGPAGKPASPPNRAGAVKTTLGKKRAARG